MLNTVLADTGPLVALFDQSDFYHRKVLSFLQSGRFKFVTTTAVITEVTHLLDFSVETQIEFFQWILTEGVIIHEIVFQDISRIVELTKKYSDWPMDFTDATLVVAAERTGIKKIVSLDSDFDIYRLPGKLRIENIL